MTRFVTGLLLFAAALPAQTKSPLKFEIIWAKPMDGHVVLIISDNNKVLVKRAADRLGVPQSDLVNDILRDHFNRSRP